MTPGFSKEIHGNHAFKLRVRITQAIHPPKKNQTCAQVQWVVSLVTADGKLKLSPPTR